MYQVTNKLGVEGRVLDRELIVETMEVERLFFNYWLEDSFSFYTIGYDEHTSEEIEFDATKYFRPDVLGVMEIFIAGYLAAEQNKKTADENIAAIEAYYLSIL